MSASKHFANGDLYRMNGQRFKAVTEYYKGLSRYICPKCFNSFHKSVKKITIFDYDFDAIPMHWFIRAYLLYYKHELDTSKALFKKLFDSECDSYARYMYLKCMTKTFYRLTEDDYNDKNAHILNFFARTYLKTSVSENIPHAIWMLQQAVKLGHHQSQFYLDKYRSKFKSKIIWKPHPQYHAMKTNKDHKRIFLWLCIAKRYRICRDITYKVCKLI